MKFLVIVGSFLLNFALADELYVSSDAGSSSGRLQGRGGNSGQIGGFQGNAGVKAGNNFQFKNSFQGTTGF